MRKSQIPILALLALLIAAEAHAQTPCDTPEPTEPFVMAPDADGLRIVAALPDSGVPLLQNVTLHITVQGENTPISQQNVAKGALVARGPSTLEPGYTCFEMPVIPVAQIPRGQFLAVAVSATGGEPLLASGLSNALPFGARMATPSIRVRQ